MHAVGDTVLPIITEVFLDLVEEILREKFPVIQIFHLYALYNAVGMIIAGIVKVVVYGRGDHNHGKADHEQQIAQPLLPSVIQIFHQKEQGRVPQKRIEKYGPVKLKAFQRGDQSLKQLPQTAPVIETVNQTVSHNEIQHQAEAVRQNPFRLALPDKADYAVCEKQQAERKEKPGVGRLGMKNCL